MSTESTESISSSSSPHGLAPTSSASTNIVDEALWASSDTESESPPVPWRTGADTPPPRRIVPYLGHTHWRANRPPQGERPLRRVRVVRVRRTKRRRIVNEKGICVYCPFVAQTTLIAPTARDFFLIMALCFVLACLLIVGLRPVALEILWYIDDPY
ncbi:hypothetical protein C8R45DRAFT_71879 [Mycena sanguinolenta]|nr:hypothetical protein C8R45DRAFT_71879 [Mycena sanguinolenta]